MSVLCGYGNNGGDGYIVARLAKLAGWQVKLIQIGDTAKISGDAAKARALWLACGGVVDSMASGFEPNTLVIDALLGTGLRGEVKEPFTCVIAQVNATANIAVCSVDVPSGLNADSGQPHGIAIKADLTCTFVALKQGLLTAFGPDHCGRLFFCGLGIGATFAQTVVPTATSIRSTCIGQKLARRPLASHKGQFGHVLLIGGNVGMSGAIRMTAKACLRSGAGLVSVLTVAENVAIVAMDCAEVMVHGIGINGDISHWLSKADVIVFGPGAADDPWSKNLLSQVLACHEPTVIDADGLNILAQIQSKLPPLEHCILTPHPKEAARLLGVTVNEVQAQRFESVKQMAAFFGAVVLLKGVGTLISDGEQIYLNRTGNPGMATAGMGDVLSGIIGGLLAQGLSLLDSATLGAYVHGAAGDLGAQQGERGLIATDLLPHIRTIVNNINP